LTLKCNGAGFHLALILLCIAPATAAAVAAAAAADPHTSRLRAMLETTYEGAVRMLEDPRLLIWHPHCAPAAAAADPHKSRQRAMLETTYEGAVRMLEDPWLFIWHLHLLLTFIHFLIWISSYGWIGGSGPKSTQVRWHLLPSDGCCAVEFDTEHLLGIMLATCRMAFVALVHRCRTAAGSANVALLLLLPLLLLLLPGP
jgi:hypothetical protein